MAPGKRLRRQILPLGRYFRDLAVIRTHITLQLPHTSSNAGRLHFGLPVLGPF